MLDDCVFEDNGLLNTSAGADDGARADADIGTELSGGVDLGGWVDEDRGHDVGGRLGDFITAGLPGLLEVESVGGDGRAGSLDLSPEVLCLADVELLAVGHVTQDILFKTDDLVLALVVVVVITAARIEVEAGLEVLRGWVGDEAGGAVEAPFDSGLDGREDGFRGEEVDTAVDEVGDAGFGLFDVVQHAAGVCVGHDTSKVCGRIVRNPRSQNDSLRIPIPRQLQHLPERERTADIGIQHKQPLRSTFEDGVPKVVEAAGGAQGLVLAEVLDGGQDGELAGGVLDEVAEDGLVVVADDINVLDGADLGNGGDAVPDDGVAGHLEEGLGHVEGEGAEASAAGGATDEDDGFRRAFLGAVGDLEGHFVVFLFWFSC